MDVWQNRFVNSENIFYANAKRKIRDAAAQAKEGHDDKVEHVHTNAIEQQPRPLVTFAEWKSKINVFKQLTKNFVVDQFEKIQRPNATMVTGLGGDVGRPSQGGDARQQNERQRRQEEQHRELVQFWHGRLAGEEAVENHDTQHVRELRH